MLRNTTTMRMMMVMAVMVARQMGVKGDELGDSGDQDGENLPFWLTPAGMAVRYAIVAVVFGGFLLFLVVAYSHAHRRIRRGKPPLLYHRWMIRSPPYQPGVPRPSPRSRFAYYGDPNYQGHPMEGFPPPPPAYNPAEVSPPTYQPPQGGSKAMADQNFSAVYTHRAGESSA